MLSDFRAAGLCTLLIVSHITVAQQAIKLTIDSLPSRDPAIAATPAGVDKNELKYNLNSSGTHFIKATFLNQAWLRANQSNPGSTVIQESNTSTLDIGLRRTRMQLFGQLSDHVFVYFQFGLNNFNYLNGGFSPTTTSNRKFQPFFHDAVGEYLVFKNRNLLNIGYGLTIVNGLSRFSGPSVATIMSMDVPVFAQATVDQTDEFARKLSLYARGQVGRLDYRIVMSDPFPIQTSGAALPSYSQNAQFALKGHRKQYQSFFMWQFFDREAHQTPGYNTGTYLGARKILNLEAGFITQQQATATIVGGDTLYHPINLWSVASFLDMPLNKTTGTAINAYLGYFSTNYGPNYLRFNGIMNPASGVAAGFPAGTQGNAFPMFGTGSVVYGQVGYLMKRNLFGASRGTLMPYAQVQIADYNRVTQPLGIYNIGLNYLINGHNAKFTLDYQNRPVYQTDGNLFTPTGRRGQLTLQYQLFI